MKTPPKGTFHALIAFHRCVVSSIVFNQVQRLRNAQIFSFPPSRVSFRRVLEKDVFDQKISGHSIAHAFTSFRF